MSVRVNSQRIFPLVLLIASLLGLGAERSAAQSSAGRVSGTVFDSTAGALLVGATVQLVDTGNAGRVWTTRSDGRGRYAFDSLVSGAYIIGISHPKVDSLLIRAPVRSVTVRAGRTSEVALALPSVLALRAAFCGGAAGGDTATAFFLGRLRRADEGRMSTAGRLRVEWGEFVIDERGARTDSPRIDATAGDDGAFALCGLLKGSRLTMRAWAGTDSSELFEITISDVGFAYRDVFVGRSSPSATGHVRGAVRNTSGAPIRYARVSAVSSEVQALAHEAGAFILRALPLGTRMLEVQAIGYEPQRVAVDVADSTIATTVSIVLEPLGREIDTVRVRAAQPLPQDRWMPGFEERRRIGLGKFIDERTIARADPLAATDLLRLVPGIRLSSTGATRNSISFARGGGLSGDCEANVFVDGVLQAGASIDDIVSAREVRAIEVYASAGSRPFEFSGPTGCGTIVIWRGMRALPR